MGGLIEHLPKRFRLTFEFVPPLTAFSRQEHGAEYKPEDWQKGQRDVEDINELRGQYNRLNTRQEAGHPIRKIRIWTVRTNIELIEEPFHD